MKREDLFLAIGQAENARLIRSEMTVNNHRNIRKRFLTLLAAVLTLTTLAVTAYAVGAFVIFDSPEAMLTAIFGDKTGHDHGEYTEVPDPERPGSILAAQPEYDRMEPDPTVVQEDIAPYVSPVGQSITYHGMTLTVDAFLYDSATKCGAVTYTLENGPEYYLQYNGQVDYWGRSHPADFSHYGYHYIIEEKCTDTLLAAAYYFRYEPERNDGVFSVELDDSATYDERMAVRERCMEQVQTEYSREDAIARAKEVLGDDWDNCVAERTEYYEDPEAVIAYELLRDQAVLDYWERNPQETCAEKILFDCSESRELSHLIMRNCGIIISPMSIQVDLEQLAFLHREDHPTNSDLVDSIVVRFTDGTEYVVRKDNVDNTLFALNTTADDTMNTDYTILTMMFNRIIDLDKVERVIINGTELKTD